MNRGSVWRIWDLHIHTPVSYLDNQFGDDWDEYVQVLFQRAIEKNIYVIGLADYFTIDGYKKVMNDYVRNPRKMRELFNDQEIEFINNVLILPNIEFRLNRFVGSGSINLHVIFSNEVAIKDIEENFLHDLDFVYEGEPQARDKTYKLKVANLSELGRKLKEEHPNFRGRTDISIGMSNAVVDDNLISEVLDGNRKFNGRYLLGVVSDEDLGGIDWNSRYHQARKVLYQKSDFLFASNPSTVQWSLAREPYVEGERKFIQEFKSLKPCVHGSDAHSKEMVGHPCIHRGTPGHSCIDQPQECELRYCWIKADTTFEGLKQIKFEPGDRVHIGPVDPEPMKNIHSLSLVTIPESVVNADLSMAGLELHLNPNLVTVVGGKGCGKTALLDLIANCFEDRCYRRGSNTEDKNSFVQRIEKDCPDLVVSLDFLGVNTEPFTKTLVDQSFFGQVKLTYLPQGKIEEYSGDRQALDRKILQIVFENDDVINRGFKQIFDQAGEDIDGLKKDIIPMNRAILDLEEESKDSIFKSTQEDRMREEGELRNHEARLKSLTDAMDETATTRTVQLKTEENQHRDMHSRLSMLGRDLSSLREDLVQFQDSMNKRLDEMNKRLSTLLSDATIPAIQFIAQLEAVDEAVKKVSYNENQVQQQIQAIEEELVQLEDTQQAQAEILRQINAKKQAIEQLDQKIQDLNTKRNEIKSLEDKRLQVFTDMLHKYVERRQQYAEVIETFSTGKTDIMGGIDFESNIHFNRAGFISFGAEILHLKKYSEEEIAKLADTLQKAISEETDDQLAETAKVFAEQIRKCGSYLTSKRTNHDLYTWGFSDYFSVSTRIFFNNIPMDSLSIGQKGTVLLKLFLAEGDYPLVVDMPEENLDNKFIYSELVTALRQAKKMRQLIVATNNANIVVNTDAEQIVIAKFDKGVINYVPGTLEDTEMREELTAILEGGEEAFRNRERKYGYSISTNA